MATPSLLPQNLHNPAPLGLGGVGLGVCNSFSHVIP